MKAVARKINKIELNTKYVHSLTGTEGKVEAVYSGTDGEYLLLRFPDGKTMRTSYFPVKECKPVVAAKKAAAKKRVVKKAVRKTGTRVSASTKK